MLKPKIIYYNDYDDSVEYVIRPLKKNEKTICYIDDSLIIFRSRDNNDVVGIKLYLGNAKIELKDNDE